MKKEKIIIFITLFVFPLLFCQAKTYTHGPIGNNPDYIFYSVENNNYCVRYKEGGNNYVQTQNGKYGPYEHTTNCVATKEKVVFNHRDPNNYDMYYININGEDTGPYKTDSFQLAGNNLAFSYTDENMINRTININGKEYGPYVSTASYKIEENAWAIAYSLSEDGVINYYVNINDVIKGPFQNRADVILHNNNWALNYMKNGTSYLDFKGEKIEIGHLTHSFNFKTAVKLSNNSWGFVYKDLNENKSYLMINGNKKGPYYRVNSLEINDNDKWAYSYYDEKLSKNIIVINGKEYEGLDLSPYDLYMADNNWAYIDNESDTEDLSNDFLFINDEYIGGFSSAGPATKKPTHRNNNIFVYYAKDNNRTYFFDKKYKIGPYEKAGVQTFRNGWGIMYWIDEKLYLKYTEGEYDDTDKVLITKEQKNDFELLINNVSHKYYADYQELSIEWDTNIESNGVVYYDLMPGDVRSGHEQKINSTQGFAKHHDVTIHNLSTAYGVMYRIESSDNSNNIANNPYKTLLRADLLINSLNNENPTQTTTQTSKPKTATQLNPEQNAIVEVDNTIKKLTINNQAMHSRLKGKIMLKVEDAGKAYYVHPKSEKMHYLGRPADAFAVMREQGVGILNIDLEKIEIGSFDIGGKDSDGDGLSDSFEDAIGTDKNKTDTDGDGFSDKDELKSAYSPTKQDINLNYDNNFSEKQKGMIFLQVEGNGEAWYINPANSKRYFLGRPTDAFSVMRNLGLGISNSDFDSMQ